MIDPAAVERFVLPERAVEKHRKSIFAKLGLTGEPDLNRWGKAVLMFLYAGGSALAGEVSIGATLGVGLPDSAGLLARGWMVATSVAVFRARTASNLPRLWARYARTPGSP
ncbi:hypothetical protein [Frankia tisae]|uniref:hypothetical protein n=1 Tax=Frankia tisae TaxID=2950104 RepID=UPI0021BE396F|nr:hypothetical protein [Frankia tisae]